MFLSRVYFCSNLVSKHSGLFYRVHLITAFVFLIACLASSISLSYTANCLASIACIIISCFGHDCSITHNLPRCKQKRKKVFSSVILNVARTRCSLLRGLFPRDRLEGPFNRDLLTWASLSSLRAGCMVSLVSDSHVPGGRVRPLPFPMQHRGSMIVIRKYAIFRLRSLNAILSRKNSLDKLSRMWYNGI